MPKQIKHTEFYVDPVKGGFHSTFPENVTLGFTFCLCDTANEYIAQAFITSH